MIYHFILFSSLQDARWRILWLRRMYGGYRAKQSIISCYSCSILIIAMIWKFHHFRTYIVHLLLQEKPLLCYFYERNYIAYSLLQEKILPLLLQKELYCLVTSTRKVPVILPAVLILGANLRSWIPLLESGGVESFLLALTSGAATSWSTSIK